MAEFAPGGEIDSTTPHQRELAYRPATNDCSESDLGLFRLFARMRLTKNPILYNANQQYHKNQSAEWYEHHLRDDTSASVAITKEARHRIDSGEAKKAFTEIVEVTEKRAAYNRMAQGDRQVKNREENM